MMRHLVVVSAILLTFASPAVAACTSFTGSTMIREGVAPALWRTDYSSVDTATSSAPWETIDFKNDPKGYMEAVLSTAVPAFTRQGEKLVGTGSEQWWIAEWLDYTTSGREPLMGLTKERGPDDGDLAPGSADNYQVWAVGFYNAPGATVLGTVFADPCNPTLPASVNFPEGTVSVKFLFTDADTNAVAYLKGAPVYKAYIDPEGTGGDSSAVKDRTLRDLRLLQVDISVKDPRATETGWVFGTFGWQGPLTGDGLYDNLVPVSLQWGNDPGQYTGALVESWINPNLKGIMFGWEPERPTLGFMGRANGPADNIRSSCLSCHAAARVPRSALGIVGFTFNLNDLNDPNRVKAHVDTWFRNIMGGELFRPEEPAVSALDYSLQLDASVWRLCRACDGGALPGTATPGICVAAGFYTKPQCTGGTITPFDASEFVRREQLEFEPPPRQ